MSECDRMRHSLGAYVLGALDVEEAAEVRRHLEDCPDCAAERDALAPLPELLSVAGGAEAATAEPLSAAFEERLLDAYARDRAAAPRRRRFARLRRRTRRRWIAVAAGVAAAAAAAIVAVALVGGDDQRPRYNLSLENTGAVPKARAYGRLDSVASGTELHLWVRGMPSDTKAVYEVLCEAPRWRTSAGTFRVNAEGRAYVILNTAMRRGEYDSIRIVRRSQDAGGDVVRSDILRAKLS
jgi:Putative zinc-finger